MFNTCVNVYSQGTVSAVSCLVVPAFICIDVLILCALRINDDEFRNHDDKHSSRIRILRFFENPKNATLSYLKRHFEKKT